MLKLRVFIFMFTICLFASTANAKVCFLPGILGGSDCLDINGNECAGFEETIECKSGYSQIACYPSYGGSTRYKCNCKSDNIKDGLETMYECDHPRGYDRACGCSPQDTKCISYLYPHESCYYFDNSVPSTNKCIEPGGKVLYASCDCPRDKYPYECDGEGLRKPTDEDAVCMDSNHKNWYTSCQCASGWSTEPCSDNTNGCTYSDKSVNAGGVTCYLCTMEPCTNPDKPNQVNMDKYLCNISSYMNDYGGTDNCEALGYSQKATPDQKCEDGTIGVVCPFDNNYIFCP